MDAVTRDELRLVITMVNENTNRGIDAINKRLDVSNGRLGKVEATTARHDQSLEDSVKRLDAVESTVAAIRSQKPERREGISRYWRVLTFIGVCLFVSGLVLAGTPLGEFLLKLVLHV